MSGSTPELALATAVDADDNADYLTISLADSLRTVDALFNNVTGHIHAGAHQGGPIGLIPATAIPDGSITSAKIADGTITALDIADGTITTAELAANTVTQLLGSYASAATFTTTTTGVWVATPVTSGLIACSGVRTRVFCSGSFYHSVAGGLISVGLMTDGAPGGGLLAANAPAPNYLVPFAWELVVTPAPGNHTFTLGLINSTAGTAGLSSGVASVLYVTEEKR